MTSVFLREGEIHALVGENGAGKTTLMRMLYGMEQPTSGTIHIRGREVQLRDAYPGDGKWHRYGASAFHAVPFLYGGREYRDWNEPQGRRIRPQKSSGSGEGLATYTTTH